MGGPQPPRRRGPDGSRPGPRAARLAFLAGVALVLAAPILLLAPPVTASHPSSGFSVSVTASPSSGSVPLTVTFSATVSSGTPVGVTWTFGDGKSWSGAGPSALVVSHEFIAVGTYSVSALVSESTGSASGAVSVNVIDGPLVVLISSTASNGTVPFTVTYHALVSGGTGTYTSFSWGFGDGGYGVGPVVQYTYRYAGQFTVTLSVIDSANDSATTSFGITAHPASASSSTAGTGPMPTSILLATAGVVGVGGLTWGVYWAGRRRPHPRARAPDEGASDDVIAMPPGAGSSVPVAPAPAPSSEPLPLLAASAPAAVSAESALAPPPSAPTAAPAAPLLSLTAVTSTPSAAAGTSTASPRSSADEPRRWSREIVAYLGGLPTLGPDDIPTLDWTQKGMSERLGTGQNQVSNVLRRLVAAGVVIEELQHVQGQPRRLKVYRLSMRGEALAREIRRRRAGQNPNFLRRDW